MYEVSTQERIANFMYAVYGFMACALLITAGSAYYVSITPAIYTAIFSNSFLLFTLFIAQIILVIILSLMINRMNFITALLMFFIYALSVGVTLSAIFLVYEVSSIYQTFLVTASTFGIMCLYGYFTRSDLTAIGNVAIMMLFGLIISLVINMFFQNQMFDLIISGIGVIVFTLLTAYDSQKIKQLGYTLLSHQETMHKVAVLGALTLYLDFINLFLYLLRFMGRQREE